MSKLKCKTHDKRVVLPSADKDASSLLLHRENGQRCFSEYVTFNGRVFKVRIVARKMFNSQNPSNLRN